MNRVWCRSSRQHGKITGQMLAGWYALGAGLRPAASETARDWRLSHGVLFLVLRPLGNDGTAACQCAFGGDDRRRHANARCLILVYLEFSPVQRAQVSSNLAPGAPLTIIAPMGFVRRHKTRHA